MGKVVVTRYIEESLVLDLEEHGLDAGSSDDDILAAAHEYDMHAWDGEITDEVIDALDEGDGGESEDVPFEDLLEDETSED